MHFSTDEEIQEVEKIPAPPKGKTRPPTACPGSSEQATVAAAAEQAGGKLSCDLRTGKSTSQESNDSKMFHFFQEFLQGRSLPTRL